MTVDPMTTETATMFLRQRDVLAIENANLRAERNRLREALAKADGEVTALADALRASRRGADDGAGADRPRHSSGTMMEAHGDLERGRPSKLRATIVVEYEPLAEHYGTDDPEKMAAIDREAWEDDVAMLLSSFDNDEFKIRVEVVD